MCRHQRRPGQQHPLCCAQTLVSADVCHLTCSTSDCLTVGETLCLLFQGGRGDHGVCGEVDQEGHDGPDDRRQTVRQRYHTTAAGECGCVGECVEVDGVSQGHQDQDGSRHFSVLFSVLFCSFVSVRVELVLLDLVLLSEPKKLVQ